MRIYFINSVEKFAHTLIYVQKWYVTKHILAIDVTYTNTLYR